MEGERGAGSVLESIWGSVVPGLGGREEAAEEERGWGRGGAGWRKAASEAPGAAGGEASEACGHSAAGSRF